MIMEKIFHAKKIAKEIQRQKQQGLGKPIKSFSYNGYRTVIVDDKPYKSKDWNTFHDFIFDYIRFIFGGEWSDSELQKKYEDRHPLIQWYQLTCIYQKYLRIENGKIKNYPIIGACSAYMQLSYSLYLVAHNKTLQDRLIKRLKHHDQFNGAFYESFVASILFNAGFDLEFEDEENSNSTHCEYIAIHNKTNRKYSVEVKHREPNKKNSNITKQLIKALKKECEYTRIVFIELNMKNHESLIEANRILAEQEKSLFVKGKPAPPAYVIVTNYPYSYFLTTIGFSNNYLINFFKIGDKNKKYHNSLREGLDEREKHSDIFGILESMKEHKDIPSTFNGEIPEYAHKRLNNRFLIGNNFLIKDENGYDIVGTLIDAVVDEINKSTFGTYQTHNGQLVHATCPLTDEELKVYKQYPDTFFGVYKPVKEPAKDIYDLYNFFYSAYKDTSKEKLLEFMKNLSNIDLLKNRSQEELSKYYAECLAENAMRDKLKKAN